MTEGERKGVRRVQQDKRRKVVVVGEEKPVKESVCSHCRVRTSRLWRVGGILINRPVELKPSRI